MAHILIIDDSLAALELMQSIVASDGHRTTGYTSVPRGLGEIAADGVDLIITDLYMPGRDGLEVMTEIRSARLRIPVVAVTGLDAGMLRVARLLGASATLNKPFTPDQLLTCVRAVLKKPGQS